MRYFAILLLLTGCVTPEQAATIGVGVGVGSIAVIQRSPLDALYSAATGKDCSIVRWDQGKSYPDYALPSVTKCLIADREFRVVS